MSQPLPPPLLPPLQLLLLLPLLLLLLLPASSAATDARTALGAHYALPAAERVPPALYEQQPRRQHGEELRAAVALVRCGRESGGVPEHEQEGFWVLRAAERDPEALSYVVSLPAAGERAEPWLRTMLQACEEVTAFPPVMKAAPFLSTLMEMEGQADAEEERMHVSRKVLQEVKQWGVEVMLGPVNSEALLVQALQEEGQAPVERAVEGTAYALLGQREGRALRQQMLRGVDATANTRKEQQSHEEEQEAKAARRWQRTVQHWTETPFTATVDPKTTTGATETAETTMSASTPQCAFDKVQWEWHRHSDGSGYAHLSGLDKLASVEHLRHERHEDMEEACLMTLVLAISAHPEVYRVEPVPPVEPHNVEASWIVQTREDQLYKFTSTAKLDGREEIVVVADTGVDQLSCFHREPDDTQIPASAFSSPITNMTRRKIVQYCYAGSSHAYREGDEAGHGTHVAGTVGGNSVTGSQKYSKGIAYKTKLAIMDISSTVTVGGIETPSDVEDMMDPGYNIGARIHSNSWGSSSPSTDYSSRDRKFDAYLWATQDMLITVSAGNSGLDGTETITSPASAKNTLTVGSVDNFPGSANVVSYYSSLGPAPGNRRKPDVMAPGSPVLSAEASAYGTTTAHQKGCTGVLLQGTSMSCPATSAAAAIIRQYFREGYYPSSTKTPADSYQPSGALLKAILVNSAQFARRHELEETGKKKDDLDPEPNNIHGFGRIQLNLGIAMWDDFKLFVDDNGTCNATDQVNTYNFTVVEEDFYGSELLDGTISFTLAWYDKNSPSGAAHPQAVNDLDLSLKLDGAIYNDSDARNTVERVRVHGVKDGDYFTVRVHCADITSTAPYGYQRYALAGVGAFEYVEDSYNYSSSISTPPPTPEYHSRKTIFDDLSFGQLANDFAEFARKSVIHMGVAVAGVILLAASLSACIYECFRVQENSERKVAEANAARESLAQMEAVMRSTEAEVAEQQEIDAAIRASQAQERLSEFGMADPPFAADAQVDQSQLVTFSMNDETQA